MPLNDGPLPQLYSFPNLQELPIVRKLERNAQRNNFKGMDFQEQCASI